MDESKFVTKEEHQQLAAKVKKVKCDRCGKETEEKLAAGNCFRVAISKRGNFAVCKWKNWNPTWEKYNTKQTCHNVCGIRCVEKELRSFLGTGKLCPIEPVQEAPAISIAESA